MFVDVLSYLVISQEKDQSTPLLSNYLYCKLCAAIPGFPHIHSLFVLSIHYFSLALFCFRLALE